MKSIALLSITLFTSTMAFAQIPSPKDQITAAVQTLPESQRDGAKVLGFSKEGNLIVLKKGSNAQICLADDPKKDGYSSACYHSDLEPFMARGRALKLEGKSRNERFDIRESEAKSGKLIMPKEARTLHIRYGKEGKFNAESGLVENTNVRYVVYIPWATAASTGLPEQPIVPGGPWIMFPGTHSAHIMITPPKMK